MYTASTVACHQSKSIEIEREEEKKENQNELESFSNAFAKESCTHILQHKGT